MNFESHWSRLGGSFTKADKRLANAFYNLGETDLSKRILDVLSPPKSIEQPPQPLIDTVKNSV